MSISLTFKAQVWRRTTGCQGEHDCSPGRHLPKSLGRRDIPSATAHRIRAHDEASAPNQLQDNNAHLAKINPPQVGRCHLLARKPAVRDANPHSLSLSSTIGILPVGSSPLPLQTWFHDAPATTTPPWSTLVAKHKPDSFSSSISNVSSGPAVFVTASKRISRSIACSTASSPHDGGCGR